ncbi:MAG TPA: dienelactone hydrolase family protein, partial [Verrucomicrobiae bacterium]|nr:dienelactone hydrolase family protein [Verrucomicrobiae bacterium]
DFGSREAYEQSIAPNRARLRAILGVVDARERVTALEYVSTSAETALVGETEAFTVHAVRWPVFEGVFGEGLWLRPKTRPAARVVALPDADQTPEMVAGLAPGLEPERQFARRLAENGCEVIVPTLIDRQDTWSGNQALNRFTNQPHREWIYRQAFELGRHVIGYEIQKVLAAVDFLESENSSAPAEASKIGVAGYGEGGLLAMYSAALDPRIDAALVSGFFDSKLQVSEAPIYRNVFGLLKEFGDAEVASLIAPRGLVIEHSVFPKVSGPPLARPGRSGAAPGKLVTPDYSVVEAEFERARSLLKPGDSAPFDHLALITGAEGMCTGPMSERALATLLNDLGVAGEALKPSGKEPQDLRTGFDPGRREHRQVYELEQFTQKLLRESEHARDAFFWNQVQAGTPAEWETACAAFRARLWEDVIGKLPPPTGPLIVRSRPLEAAETGTAAGSTNSWVGYGVTLDLYPDVFAWGYLLMPKNLKPNERRPVIVCQHGLEGVPGDVINANPASQAFGYYKAFAARLAERGFVVFAPHNPYRGGDRFRHLQRLANPLGLSLFSVIIAQHERILDWLAQQPFVDPKRIGFYGLSYGGKTAMRVPAVVERYALSICSADFNDWVRKNADTDFPLSYMFMNEYELPEFNLGGTFNYAEMAALIAPRPFMVERGHNDGVGIDEWVASEYAKVRRLYDRLGLGNRTAIEFFNGPHTIHGVGTFQFLHDQLGWPSPPQ